MACSTFVISKCLISTYRITKLQILCSVEVSSDSLTWEVNSEKGKACGCVCQLIKQQLQPSSQIWML